jgi:hypothetical protein
MLLDRWANFSRPEITFTHTDIVHFIHTLIGDTHKHMQPVNFESAAWANCSCFITRKNTVQNVLYADDSSVLCKMSLWLSGDWNFKNCGILPLLLRLLQSKCGMKVQTQPKVAGTSYVKITLHNIGDQNLQKQRCGIQTLWLGKAVTVNFPCFQNVIVFCMVLCNFR